MRQQRLCELDAKAHVEAEEEAVDGDAAVNWSEEGFIGGFFDGVTRIETDFKAAGDEADAAADLSAELRDAFFAIYVIIAVIKGDERAGCCHDTVDIERAVVKEMSAQTDDHGHSEVFVRLVLTDFKFSE